MMEQHITKGSLVLVSYKPYADSKRTINRLGIVVGCTRNGSGHVDAYQVLEFNHKGPRLLRHAKSFFRYDFAKPFDDGSQLSFDEHPIPRNLLPIGQMVHFDRERQHEGVRRLQLPRLHLCLPIRVHSVCLDQNHFHGMEHVVHVLHLSQDGVVVDV